MTDNIGDIVVELPLAIYPKLLSVLVDQYMEEIKNKGVSVIFLGEEFTGKELNEQWRIKIDHPHFEEGFKDDQITIKVQHLDLFHEFDKHIFEWQVDYYAFIGWCLKNVSGQSLLKCLNAYVKDNTGITITQIKRFTL